MKSSWDILKKIGAGIIVLLLILMLGITFSSQPMDEIIALISGSSKAGSYRGNQISLKDYSFIYNECENQFQKYGFTEIPPYLLQNCIYENLINLYVKPDIADDLGIGVSKDSVEKQIINYVTEVYKTQKLNRLSEDIISVEELYNREVSHLSIDKRIRFIKSSLVDNIFSSSIPVSEEDWQIINYISNNNVILDLNIVVFNNQDLLNSIQVEVEEKEIQELYNKEKDEFYSKEESKDKKYSPYEERYKFLKEKIQNEKKREKLSLIKDELNKLNNERQNNFENITKITKIQPVNKKVFIKELDNVLIQNKKINLVQKDFMDVLISNNRNNLIGPITDKENTIYLKVNSVTIQPIHNTKSNQEISKEKLGQYLSYVFYQYILEQYKKRGNFQLYDLNQKNQKK